MCVCVCVWTSFAILWPQCLCLVLHSADEPGELSQWLCCDDSILILLLFVFIRETN